MKKLLNIIAIALLLCGISVSSYAGNNKKTEIDNIEIGMVTGSKAGTYITFGHDIAKEAGKSGIKLNVYESGGSIENINRITSKERVGLAIVQSDVLGFLNRSNNQNSIETAKKLRLVAPFYNEEVHILARKTITSLDELNGKKIVVGSEGSGSMITAVNIFSMLNIVPSKMYKIAPASGVVAVLNNDVDAIVFVGGKPVKMFKNMEELSKITEGANAGKLDGVHFLPITDERLLKEYKPATITHDDYKFVMENVPTIAVTALLVTYDYTLKTGDYYENHCKNMEKLAGVLKNNFKKLQKNGHKKWQEVDLTAEIGNWKRDACSQDVFINIPEVNDPKALEKDLIGVIKSKN